MNTISDQLVSVLMTAYNREDYIAEAIESVLASTYQNWELIVVDDRSNDKTVEISRSYEQRDSRIKVYVNEKNLGDYPNRNKAASYAKGKYLKYLDSDDIIYSYGLQTMVEAMGRFPEAGIGLSFNSYQNDVKLPVSLTPTEVFECHFFKTGLLYIGPSGCIYQRDFFKEIGAFKMYGVASDYEFNIRAGMHKPIALMQRDLIWWRQHEGQEISLSKTEYFELNYKIHQEIVKNVNLPLSKLKRKELVININKNYARKIILLFIKCQFRQALKILNITKLPLSSFVYALMPRFLRKKLL
jgi:glycosyltransferase involved in cell wall biosynthesis